MAINPTQSCRLSNFLALESPVLDVRTPSEFFSGHLKQSGHIPFSELYERLHELPKNTKPIRVVSSRENAAAVFEFLSLKNYEIDGLLHWEVPHEELESQGVLSSGEKGIRLWEPTPALITFLSNIESGLYPVKTNKPTVLDIGCGSGRDLVFLATNGWVACGIDYISGALEKLTSLAKHNRVEAKTICLDLEKNTDSFSLIDDQYDLVQVFRYLHRPLLPLLDHKIKPGGYLIYQTFVEGCEAFGKPKRARFILKHGELARIFSHYEILEDSEVLLEDGRPTNLFIARKPV